MPATPFDSAIYGKFLGDADLTQLFSDSAEVRSMLIVEGALAWAQAGVGMIPAEAAAEIQKASYEVSIDPGGLAAATAQNGVCVPALVAAFRKAMDGAEAAQFIHWGATSQDIYDTGLALRLRRVCDIFEDRLQILSVELRSQARAHRALPMAARTWGTVATPTSFGAVVATWGRPCLSAQNALTRMRAQIAAVSLSGAAGTHAAMGPDGAEVRAQLADGLGLSDPGRSTHSTRDHITAFAAWMTGLAGSLMKMSEDLLSLSRSGEVSISGGGSSSTMPQKQNPVQASAMSALGHLIQGLNVTLQSAAAHRDQRDGTAWMREWLALPQMCMALGRMLAIAGELVPKIEPQPERMQHHIDPDGLGLIYAEALSFALARQMPRPDAQAKVKELCLDARAIGTPLAKLAAREWPTLDLDAIFSPEAQLGDAPSEADAFGQAVLATY